MGSGRTPRLGPIRAVGAGTRVARLEVFFDLVFVYGFFNIARYAGEELTLAGLYKGLLVLALLWLTWVAHMLVAQRVRLGEGYAPLVVFIAMAALLAMALTIPRTFGEIPGGVSGPLVFPACYFTIRALHLGLHFYAVRGVPVEQRQILRISAAMVVSTGLLYLAALLPWLPERYDQFWVRVGLWTLALLVEYGTGLAVGLAGWRVAAPGHFVERFELMVNIAFGELIISIGIGSGVLGEPITWQALFFSMLGMLVIASLWWAYFDLIAPAAGLAMHGSRGRRRVALARDGYIYLHLPMIAGLILVALGGEEMLRHLGATESNLVRPLHGLGPSLLYAGVAVYLASLVAFQFRLLGTVLWTRVGAVVLAGAAIPFAGHLPALAALGAIAGLCAALVTAETILLADARHALHAAVRAEREAQEAREAEWWRQRR
ncbi:low temperature requirement protein A [Micromonospora echinofusca]|uniref:Low temperature requirement protein A n=1 Tax=Micromonospora echinofusca TaxID=47858 RepID=A0ABS3VQ84_MICEH|nr:low temperature requirement protein A [Micromonospora echinofusca]MBO4206553.1 low temperature requirement protein A [Micromonospora echinofusca]